MCTCIVTQPLQMSSKSIHPSMGSVCGLPHARGQVSVAASPLRYCPLRRRNAVTGNVLGGLSLGGCFKVLFVPLRLSAGYPTVAT